GLGGPGLGGRGGGPPHNKPPGPKTPKGCGCVINLEDRILGEEIPVIGTPFSLNYQSFRASGDSLIRSVTVPVVGDSTGLSNFTIDRAIVQLDVAGKHYEKSVASPTVASDPVVLTWDGRDAYGRRVSGATIARVSLGYVLKTTYASGRGGQSLGNSGATGVALGEATGNRQIERTVWSRQTTALGVPGTDADGLGGWTLSPHHVFDPQGLGTVYRGDGSVIRGDLSPSTVRSLTCTSGSCSPVITLGQLQVYVSALAYGRNGDLYIADQGILLGNAITVY